MSYLRVYAKSEVSEGESCAKITGSGSVRSNDARTERLLSDDFAGCVYRNTELAYDLHRRR